MRLKGEWCTNISKLSVTFLDNNIIEINLEIEKLS